MADSVLTLSPKLVTVFGGAGFLGRYVVRALAKRGYRVRVATRRPNLAWQVVPFGVVGQIHAVQANLRYPDSVERAVTGSYGVVNLVGILQESGRQGFDVVHAEGAGLVAEAAVKAGAERLIHVSALGADAESESGYARSKALGETNVLGAFPGAAVLRPSVLFGPGDQFFNRFAGLARMLPVLPLAGAETRFQPVYAADVSETIGRAMDGAVAGGRVYELGGPQIRSLREIVAYILEVTERRRLILGLPLPAARLQAMVLEILDTLSLGLLPNSLKLNRDQITLLQRHNVVSEAATAEGRTLQGIGITPTAYQAIVPSYLVRFRRTGQFEVRRDPVYESASPDVIAPESAGAGSQFDPGRASGPAVGDRAAG